MEDIDLDEGWKITLLKIKALKDKADLLQIHMNKLSEKYSISKSVKSCDKNTKLSETNDENTSMVSNVHDVTLVCTDDEHVQVHKPIILACGPLKKESLGKITSEPVDMKNCSINETNESNDSMVSSVYTVTLVGIDDEQIPAHRLILSTFCLSMERNLRKTIEKETINGSDFTNVTLVCEEIKDTFAHKEIISSNSIFYQDNIWEEMPDDKFLYQSCDIIKKFITENCQHEQVFPLKGPDKSLDKLWTLLPTKHGGTRSSVRS